MRRARDRLTLVAIARAVMVWTFRRAAAGRVESRAGQHDFGQRAAGLMSDRGPLKLILPNLGGR